MAQHDLASAVQGFALEIGGHPRRAWIDQLQELRSRLGPQPGAGDDGGKGQRIQQGANPLALSEISPQAPIQERHGRSPSRDRHSGCQPFGMGIWMKARRIDGQPSGT